MLKKVILGLDTTNPSSWTTHNVEDIHAFLRSQFPKFPNTARIYHGDVSKINEVTPFDEAGIERLGALEGTFYVLVFPEGVVAFFVGFFLVVAAVAFIPRAPTAPPPPAARNQQTASPNNELSNRANVARINGRIPDIFGTVRSTPDLISAPYRIFENNREVEYAYMCIGRGEYNVSDIRDGDTLCLNITGTSVAVYAPYTSPNSEDEPQLLIGASIGPKVLSAHRSNSVNGQVLRPPNTATITGSNNIRFAYPNRILSAAAGVVNFASEFVDGDILDITNADQAAVTEVYEERRFGVCGTSTTVSSNIFGSSFNGGGYLYWEVPNYDTFFIPPGWVVSGTIILSQFLPDVGGHTPADFSGTYTIAEIVTVVVSTGTLVGVRLTNPAAVNANWASYGPELYIPDLFGVQLAATIAAFDLAGTYTVLSVTAGEITLDNPSGVNADWDLLEGVDTPYMSPVLTTTGDKWVGPFILEDEQTRNIYANFVAVNGLYKDNGVTQLAEYVVIIVEVTPVDLDDNPLASPETFQVVLFGSSALKETVAVTLKGAFITFYGRCSVRASRLTPSDEDFEGSVVDEVRWRDLYSVSPVEQTNFGNVTTVHSVTLATASALAVKERKLNLEVQRKIPERTGDSTFSTTLVGSDDAADILAAICRDQYIGNRPISELNIPNFYDTADAVEAYFGHANARKFSYTFDNDNISFEEAVAAVAGAMFCIAYRRGNIINVSFEKETADSTLLFNHRNKIPGTEERAVSFGRSNDFDGIQYSYVDPADDSIITIFLPEDTPTRNPRKVESIGVRNHLQGYFHAWRLWNRIQYQNTIASFEATQEADLLVINDRILVADNTRPGTQDGEVLAVDGLELTLSQEVDFTLYDTYVIFLQHTDGVAETIDITEGSAPNKVVLADAPRLSLVTDSDMYARTAYVIVGDEETKQTAFLVTEKNPQGRMTSQVKAINYDARYYANDLDYINEIIGENGYGPTGGWVPGSGTGFPLPEADFIIQAEGFSGPEDTENVGYNTGGVGELLFGSFLGNGIVRVADVTSDPRFEIIIVGTFTQGAFLSLRMAGPSVDVTYYSADATFVAGDGIGTWHWPTQTNMLHGETYLGTISPLTPVNVRQAEQFVTEDDVSFVFDELANIELTDNAVAIVVMSAVRADTVGPSAVLIGGQFASFIHRYGEGATDRNHLVLAIARFHGTLPTSSDVVISWHTGFTGTRTLQYAAVADSVENDLSDMLFEAVTSTNGADVPSLTHSAPVGGALFVAGVCQSNGDVSLAYLGDAVEEYLTLDVGSMGGFQRLGVAYRELAVAETDVITGGEGGDSTDQDPMIVVALRPYAGPVAVNAFVEITAGDDPTSGSIGWDADAFTPYGSLKFVGLVPFGVAVITFSEDSEFVLVISGDGVAPDADAITSVFLEDDNGAATYTTALADSTNTAGANRRWIWSSVPAGFTVGQSYYVIFNL